MIFFKDIKPHSTRSTIYYKHGDTKGGVTAECEKKGSNFASTLSINHEKGGSVTIILNLKY